MTILVAGGLGYIGSHVVREFVRAGRGGDVVVVDNLATGFRAACDASSVRAVVIGDVSDEACMEQVFAEHAPVTAVVHLCALSIVGDSVRRPLEYYERNVGATTALLAVAQRHGVTQIVFTSTAAVYGEPERTPIDEDAPKRPLNPYGKTKLCIEDLLHDCEAAYGMRAVSLRYFNACGADRDGDIGEAHDPETHLIPLVLRVAAGHAPQIGIFGDDFPTPDGTAVRDYVHVTDLAKAHILAVDHLAAGGASTACNLGSAGGHSVRQVIDAARRITQHPIPAVVQARRAGDPAVLTASTARAADVLGWKPEHSLDDIIASAWQWHRSHPDGFTA